MFKIEISLVCVIVLVMECNCWVFNNVNYTALEAKSLDVDDETENEVEIKAHKRFTLIFPGTKWCGAGNVADGYEDLGPLKDTDKCCREHDLCPDVIEAGETKHNLTNPTFYSRLNCECDNRFRECLRSLNDPTAKVIGKMYFNAIGTKCFREDYPIKGCKKRGGFLLFKCIEYDYDFEGEIRYQWFDVPTYQ